MTIARPSQKTVTQVIDVMQWTLCRGGGRDATAMSAGRSLQCRVPDRRRARRRSGRIRCATCARGNHALGRGRVHKIQD
jgi:hypothetical protein